VLTLARVCGGYGRTVVVRDVDLAVPASSVTALIGPNGAGKTTLLSTISGLLPIMSGAITILGCDATQLSADQRARHGLSHIPQGRGIYRGLSVRENLVMQAPRGAERKSIERAVAAFPILGRRLGQRAGTLSGGEQQMLSMAAAYVRGARVILADEASLGLAPMLIDTIFQSLRELASQGVALLLVDQFVTRVLDMADTAYVLRNGQIAFHGTPAQLQTSDIFEYYVGNGSSAS
jgi:branched-chain amino acid transport system ATP-binding protein